MAKKKAGSPSSGADTRKPKSLYTDTSNDYVKAYLPRDGSTPPRVVELDRLIMEKKLGRKLKYNEVVHHQDDDKQNNAMSNLEVITRGENNANRGPKKKKT
jgi:hypothetical protein